MSELGTLPCPYSGDYECRWAGDALPPGGQVALRPADVRCPHGYLPHRVRPAPLLAGKKVVTAQPAQRRFEPGEDGAAGPALADSEKDKRRD